jgi:putative transposase
MKNESRQGRKKYAFVQQLPCSFRFEHKGPGIITRVGVTRSALAVSRRDRKSEQMNPVAIGGAADHVHVLVSLPPTLSVAKAAQLLKGNSSKWIHETFPKMRSFEWQEGYGAFSIGISSVDATVAYIRNQADHHRTRSFREELSTMLRKHGFEFKEEMLD